MSPFKAGLLAIVLVVVGAYFAYTQANPFADPYEFSASFNTVNNLAPDSPVRIAGVEVGTVKTVEAIEGGGDGRDRDDGDRGARAPDPRGRRAQDPPAHLPRGQRVRGPGARQPVGADARLPAA